MDTNATGLAKFKLSKDGTELHFRLNVANIEDVTQAHIHLGAEGENGPVVAFLFGFEEDGVTVNGGLAQGTLTEDDVIALPDEGFDGTFESLLAAMRSGNTYVNVHTIANPPGEIRGQIQVAGPPSTEAGLESSADVDAVFADFSLSLTDELLALRG